MVHFLKEIFKKKEEGPVFFNILTRTSGRPKGFKKCRNSILNQNHKNFKHLISYDTPEDLDYITFSKNDLLVEVEKENYSKFSKLGKEEDFKPYNLYCNRLLQGVGEGWVLFLDDDDMFLHPNVFFELSEYIINGNRKDVYIWRTRYPDGKEIPGSKSYENREIIYMDVDTACFAVHSSIAKKEKWDAWRGADFRYLKKITARASNVIWLDETFTKKNNFGDQGMRNDIE